jgi:hypothetical protein
VNEIEQRTSGITRPNRFLHLNNSHQAVHQGMLFHMLLAFILEARTIQPLFVQNAIF